MIARRLQIFSMLLTLATPFALQASELAPGTTHRLVFRDVDGNDLSTADGHVTIITAITRENEEKARAVADLVPDQYRGDTKYRYITLVNFQRKLPGPLQGLTRVVIRNRLDAEAEKLKPEYEAKKLTRDPRSDLYVIADFDGRSVTQLGLPVEGDEIAVFVFNGEGKLIARWAEVPDGSLAKAIAAAG